MINYVLVDINTEHKKFISSKVFCKNESALEKMVPKTKVYLYF